MSLPCSSLTPELFVALVSALNRSDRQQHVVLQ
jgi:hypothetical protein